jgi:putative SOS response-associated peptidase YedK
MVSWVILEPREYAEWLSEAERPPVHLLRVLSGDDLTVTQVATAAKKAQTKPKESSANQSGFLFG